MKQQFLDAITANYGFKDVTVSSAPRQLVAETCCINTAEGQTYFCKIVDKPLFIPKILGSLPVLDAIHRHGFERVNYPIKTLSNKLYVMVDGVLIALFTYIDAQQSDDYDAEAFGRLIGSIHALTPKIDVPMPEEHFSLKYRETFEIQLEKILMTPSEDGVIQRLQRLLRRRETEIRRHYAALQRLVHACSGNQFDLVMTHGDAGGNVLVKSAKDLYIIDWDEILLAPPERDLWIHDQNPEFMAGYRSIFPHYRTNDVARNYCVCNQHFDYMMYYLTEIFGDFPEEHRNAVVGDFEDYFEGWMKPHLDAIE